MASVVQGTCAGTSAVSSATVVVAVTNVPTIGNWIIAIAVANSTNGSVTISDTVNTWQQNDNADLGETAFPTLSVGIASAKVSGSLSGKSITATWSPTATAKALYVFEVANLTATTWLGASQTALQTPASTVRTGGATLTPGANDLCLNAFMVNQAETSFTAGAGWTRIPTVTGATAGFVAAGTTVSLEACYVIGNGTAWVDATGGASKTYVTLPTRYNGVAAATPSGRPKQKVVGQAVTRAATRMQAYSPYWRPRKSGLWVPKPGLVLPAGV